MLKYSFILIQTIFYCFCFGTVFGQLDLDDIKTKKTEAPKSIPAAVEKKVEKQPVKQQEQVAASVPKPTLKPFKEPMMIQVEGGGFKMGSNDGFVNEKPEHQVILSSFYIGKFEVTQVEWKEIMNNNPSGHEACDNCPVENVSYMEIQDFISKLNKKTGKEFRLPTEAEWEYAARGGNKSNNTTYSGSSDYTTVGWCQENSDGHSHPIGTKLPNELGIYDMCGNVWEICVDWYDKGYYATSPADNPKGGEPNENKVRRGGSFSQGFQESRSTLRNIVRPDVRTPYNGFRLARTK